ncbi:hypothetical protein ACFX1X_009807 [Malus domestica]
MWAAPKRRDKSKLFARLITVVDPVANESGKKRHSTHAQKILVEKKLKTSSTAHKGPPTAEKFVIDLTFSKGKKENAARYEHVTSAMLKMASTIADRIG